MLRRLLTLQGAPRAAQARWLRHAVATTHVATTNRTLAAAPAATSVTSAPPAVSTTLPDLGSVVKLVGDDEVAAAKGPATELRVRGLSSRGVESLCGVLKRCSPKKLSLRFDTGATISPIVWGKLGTALAQCSQLESLALSNACGDDVCALVLAEALGGCQQLTELELRRSHLVVKALAPRLPLFPRLTALSVDGKLPWHFESALSHCPALSCVSLTSAGRGLRWLRPFLCHNPKLTQFCTDAALAHLPLNCPNLTHLQLKVGSDLEERNQPLSSVTHLHMCVDDREKMNAVLARCPNVTSLSLEDTDVLPVGALEQLTTLQFPSSAPTGLPVELLRGRFPRLTTLMMRGEIGDPADLGALAAVLQQRPQLTDVEVRGEVSNAQELVAELPRLTTLKTIAVEAPVAATLSAAAAPHVSVMIFEDEEKDDEKDGDNHYESDDDDKEPL